MYRSQHRRNKDITIQPQPNSMPVVLPSASQSSFNSLSSSDASSTLLPAVPPSNSSQSVIISSDQPLPSFTPVTSSKNRFFPLSKSAVPRSSPSLAQQMGQTLSRPTPAPISSAESTSSGNRFRRVWAGRRKKSEDVTVLLGGQSVPTIGAYVKGKEHDVSGPSTPAPGTPVTPKGADFQLSSSLNVFSGNRRQSQSPKSPVFSGSAPLPTAPPSTTEMLASKKLPLTPTTSSPPSSYTVASMSPLPALPVPSDDRSIKNDNANIPKDKPDPDTKQDWRKSDSTMISHITIRPGAFGNRSPRPVSLAESSHSGHTIVPVNKRLSALITDADFAMPEEGDLDQDTARGSPSGRPSPTPSLKAIHRRSLSLSPGFGVRMKPSSPEPMTISESAPSVGSLVTPSATPRDTPTLTRAAAEGFITPTSLPGAAHSTSSHIRGRLAAWTVTPPLSSPSSRGPERPLPSPPPPQPRVMYANHPPVSHPPSFRQTAISMTGSLAPVAAGIAIGIGKRAAEKVHRVWGGLSSSSSTHSGYSSSSSNDHTGPSSYQSHRRADDGLAGGRSASSQAIPGQFPKSGWRGKRGTPNAPSGTWSVASSTASSVSDCEALTMPSGPNLGTRLRGPRRNAAGSPMAGGLVFGRSLEVCVQETTIERSLDSASQEGAPRIKPLEERALPALVVRCAQHLLQWGVQEEGLFRVSGRPAHVAKLRSEFDTGADYNLVESDPGDLDPHAVASIFKAYLRELPESLLTLALAPRFEAIMLAENAENEAAANSRLGSGPKAGIGSKGPTLPSGPRNGISLRKPPSLSTLAMPNFANMRTMSATTIDALTVLITLLPAENRDLLLTVTELITATAARSKETKMPLGNLLLVFCPSLNMNPSLLRVLCEAKNIWNRPTDSPELPAASIESPSNAADSNTGEEVGPSDEPESELGVSVARPRLGGPITRDPVGTLFVPTDHFLDSVYRRTSSNSGSADARSYVSALEGPMESDTRSSTPWLGSPHILPPLSSSTDSLATPSTMSEASSFSQPPSISSQSSAVETAEKPDMAMSNGPVIVENNDLALPAVPRRPVISAPVPFPSSRDGSAPHIPLSSRKSFALLSFPPLRTSEASSASTSSSSSSWGRSKRPSLHLLFSKKSTPSFKTTASPAIDSSPSSAPAMKTDYIHTAPPSMISLVPDLTAAPPTLITPISSSPMNLGFDDAALNANVSADDNQVAPQDTIRLVHTRTDSTTSLYSTPQETPIAFHFRGRLPSVLVPADADVGASVTPPKAELPKSPSQLSLTPSITIGFEEDDWAQSVLMATGTDVEKTEVSEAAKIVESR